MYVEKIEIPAFRVLRNVEIEFSGTYEPQVFPLGSENGGGKSTILQLVFVLLHCSADRARFPYIANLLASDSTGSDGEERTIARITIRLDVDVHVLEFVSLHDQFLSKRFVEEPPKLGFESEVALKRSQELLDLLLERYKRAVERMQTGVSERELRPYEAWELFGDDSPRRPSLRNEQEVRNFVKEGLERMQKDIERLEKDIESLNADMTKIRGILVADDYKFITTYQCMTTSGREMRAMVCRVPGQNASTTEKLLSAVASKIFLLGPSNQQYLFLEKDARKALLTTASRLRLSRISGRNDSARTRPQIEYLTDLDKAEHAMDGFYAYDWLSMEPLVQLFLNARDQDFKEVVDNQKYGNLYITLLQEVNSLLKGKEVRPRVDSASRVSGVDFIVIDNRGCRITLSPEDLSQGELKRLMIYSWLRANNAVDALVLIDEIETSFHPDWQYGIVRDLQDWAPKNQYILATHSYELCNALTPGHVRELEPRLQGWDGATNVKPAGQNDA